MMVKKHQTVEHLLHQHPAAFKAFIHYNTNCIGCAFDRFCTLEDVSRHYQIPLSELEKTIRQLIANPNT